MRLESCNVILYCRFAQMLCLGENCVLFPSNLQKLQQRKVVNALVPYRYIETKHGEMNTKAQLISEQKSDSEIWTDGTLAHTDVM